MLWHDRWKHNVKGRSPDTNYHILYESIYTKCPEEANPFSQKVDLWLPGAGGRVREEWGLTAVV